MLGEAALALVGKEALKTTADLVVKHYGPSLLDRFDKMVREWRRASHPSLGEVREICDFLEAFLISGSTDRQLEKYAFPKTTQDTPFRRDDLGAKQVADLWFRTNTDEWKKRIVPVSEKWLSLIGPNPGPYFRGRVSSELNYEKVPKGKSRHPIFRNVHPFIMTSGISKAKLGADPVGEVLKLFVDGWHVFSDDKYTVFRGGTVLRIGAQAYAEGIFTITKESAFWSESIRHEEVHLWRCIMVTGYHENVEAMNIGVPVWSGGGSEYLDHVKDWMRNFRMLREA